ncbi:hypothetical protein P7K49_013195 [Saguinus oedipus]|uniref:Ig-like domain-containing protein n=1 Tax=Saguinus oedipus TaxID=9490 RepID=A0ABQ9VG17_SAGOE|nr:hypothetical protein P7K49_013195 [Saguinus oedipus]
MFTACSTPQDRPSPFLPAQGTAFSHQPTILHGSKREHLGKQSLTCRLCHSRVAALAWEAEPLRGCLQRRCQWVPTASPETQRATGFPAPCSTQSQPSPGGSCSHPAPGCFPGACLALMLGAHLPPFSQVSQCWTGVPTVVPLPWPGCPLALRVALPRKPPRSKPTQDRLGDARVCPATVCWGVPWPAGRLALSGLREWGSPQQPRCSKPRPCHFWARHQDAGGQAHRWRRQVLGGQEAVGTEETGTLWLTAPGVITTTRLGIHLTAAMATRTWNLYHHVGAPMQAQDRAEADAGLVPYLGNPAAWGTWWAGRESHLLCSISGLDLKPVWCPHPQKIRNPPAAAWASQALALAGKRHSHPPSPVTLPCATAVQTGPGQDAQGSGARDGQPRNSPLWALASTGKGVKNLSRKPGESRAEALPQVEGRGPAVDSSARPWAAEALTEDTPAAVALPEPLLPGGPPSPFLTSLHLSDYRDRPWNPPTFSPPLLVVAEGDNATFTCSFANTSESFVLNWYRMSPSNQTDKLAAFPEDRSQPGQDRRFRVTQLPNGRDFRMSVIGARHNDSGTYLCGAISLAPKAQIKESPRAELRVTERNPDVPTAPPSPSPRPAGQFQGLMVGIVVGLLASLVLLAWVLVAICPRAAQGNVAPAPQPAPRTLLAALTRPPRFLFSPAMKALGLRPPPSPWGVLLRVCLVIPRAVGVQRTDQPLKEDPSAVPAFSVDYGELDFQWREKTPEPPTPCVPEQTEYATIVFSSGLGASSPARRGSAEGPRSPRPLRPEDGHCSWPL